MKSRGAIFLASYFILVLGLSACLPRVSPDERYARHKQAEALIDKGTALLRENTPVANQEAYTAFELARELAEYDPRPIDGIGCVLVRRGKLDEAESYFQRAVLLSPSYGRAFAHLGYIELRRGNKDKALEFLSFATRVSPLDYRIRNNYAVVLKNLGSSYAAEKELYKALELAPEIAPVINENLKRLRDSQL